MENKLLKVEEIHSELFKIYYLKNNKLKIYYLQIINEFIIIKNNKLENINFYFDFDNISDINYSGIDLNYLNKNKEFKILNKYIKKDAIKCCFLYHELNN